jgi:hypothetical protein
MKDLGFALVIGILVLLILWVGYFQLVGEPAGEAQTSAQTWAAQHFPDDVKTVECVSRDSDGDGYASCTVFLRSTPSPVPLECGTEWF